MMKTRAVGLGTQADELDAQELVAAERQSDRATNEPLRTPGAGCPGKGCHTIFWLPHHLLGALVQRLPGAACPHILQHLLADVRAREHPL